ncbi:hypothetical protein ACFE04_002130 [Oxalis oulophora]
MATTVIQANQFVCKTLSTTLSANITRPSVLLPLNKTKFQSTVRPIRARQVFPIRALEDEEVSGRGVAVAVEEENPLSETESLKKAQIASFDGTSRGLTASNETRAEIVELITQLEVENPTPAPTEALPLLNGKWILVGERNGDGGLSMAVRFAGRDDDR